MAYADLKDLANAATGGWAELAQRASDDPAVTGELMKLTAEGGDRSAWTPEARDAADQAIARCSDALDRASRHADTYLFPKYRTVMPLPDELVQGSSLVEAVAAIALKRLYGTTVPEDLRRGAAWADDYLRDLASGKVSLGAGDQAVAQAPGATVVRTPSKSFDWDRY
jgi:phage gp36-like protein